MVRTTAIALAALAVAATAQTGRPVITHTGSIDNMSKIRMVGGVSDQDRQFMIDLAAADWIEIKTSELAQTHGMGDWVKHFGKDMIDDHTATQTELVQIANKQNIDLPTDQPAEIDHMYKRLMMLNGEAFDAAYRQLQIKGHEQAAAVLAKEIKYGHNQDVKYFAIKTLPMVKMHLRMAMEKNTMTHGG